MEQNTINIIINIVIILFFALVIAQAGKIIIVDHLKQKRNAKFLAWSKLLTYYLTAIKSKDIGTPRGLCNYTTEMANKNIISNREWHHLTTELQEDAKLSLYSPYIAPRTDIKSRIVYITDKLEKYKQKKPLKWWKLASSN